MSIGAIRRFVFTYIALAIGSFIGAISVMLFLSPFEIAPGGISGIAVLLNHVFGTPIGMMVFILNIPIQIIGLYMLPHGWRTLARTLYVLIIYALALDFLVPVLPAEGISTNLLLNAIFGGVIGGISGGLVIRVGGTFGGTSTLALIIQRRTGMPLSTIYLYTDTVIIAGAGLIFGWEAALYATITMFITGLASDHVMEGPSVIRTATIVTDQPDAVSHVVIHQLHRGVTGWEAQGMYTGLKRSVLFVTISRSQVGELRNLIVKTDPNAFIVIGHGHTAFGEGFQTRSPVLDALTSE